MCSIVIFIRSVGTYIVVNVRRYIIILSEDNNYS